jgi:hypothetical protein
VRVILLVATVFLLVRLVSHGQYVTLFVCFAAVVYQVLSMIRYVETTNRNLQFFLQSIEYSNLSQRYRAGPAGRSFSDLDRAF